VSTLSPIALPESAPAPRTGPRRLPLDPVLTATVIALGICSVLTLRSATSNLVPGDPGYYTNRQALYLGAGLVLMLIISRIDYAHLRRLRNAIYALLMASILAVLAVGHYSSLGAQRSIQLPFFSFQGSEIGKDLLIVALAASIVDNARSLGARETTARVLLAALVPAVFVVAQPDLGSGMVYMFIAAMLLFVAGTPWRRLAAITALVIACIAIVLAGAPAAGVHVLKPYQEQRLTAFLDPSSHSESSYQLRESEIAVGSGGRTGRANPTQIKLNFVPEDNTDFIFAAVGENWGFAGAALVLLLYALLLWRTMRILLMSKDLFGSLIAAGVAAMLMFQVFVNVGMVVGIMPITGVTLPLMSYGGSSVIAVMVAVGLLQSIYVRSRAAYPLGDRVLR